VKRNRIGRSGLWATFGGLVLSSWAWAQRGSVGGVQLNALDLPPGKSFTVSFDVTINPLPPGLHQVSNQGTVTADGPISVLTDDPDTGQADDPTITGVFMPTPTPTPTATSTPTPSPTPTHTPASLCSRPDGCFNWELLEVDPSVPEELRFRWRLTNNCTSALAKADFRFRFAGLVIGMDGDEYAAPSGRRYLVDIIGPPHPGVNYFPIGAGLPPGEAEDFEFRVVASSLRPEGDLWNTALTETDETGAIFIRKELCFALPPLRLGPSPRISTLTQVLALLAAGALFGLRLLRRPVRGRAAGRVLDVKRRERTQG
jgi:hypothetical protein